MDTPIISLALEFLHDVEGRYVNNKHDRGGETYMGIARNKNPDWPGWEIVDALRNHPNFPDVLDDHSQLQSLVDELYKTVYWDKCRCDDMPPEMAMIVFGSAVNHGPFRASMLLQQSLRVKMDGIIGNQTLSALNSLIKRFGINVVIVEYLGFRAQFYHDIVAGDSSQAVFLRGWFNRLFKLQQFVLGM